MSSIKSYIIGFVLSVVLTLGAYFAVTEEWLSGTALIALIMGLASLQFIVQLFFFLHLGSESKPRWKLAAFLFMFLVLVIIVGGSLWIMANLNYNMMMTPEQMDEYMLKQSNKGF